MAFNYNKLIGKIIEVFGTRGAFASAMGISDTALRQKLQSERNFRQDEIYKACNLLDIDVRDISLYFFVEQVKKS